MDAELYSFRFLIRDIIKTQNAYGYRFRYPHSFKWILILFQWTSVSFVLAERSN
jgi:hypothetical protein